MGQYYRGLIIDEDNNSQVLVSYDFDNGAKLMEHSWVGNNFVNAVLSLIHNKRRRIAWIGDYANDPFDGESDYYTTTMSKEAFMKYYRVTWSSDKFKIQSSQFSETALDILNMETTGMYLVNHDNREYIDLEAYVTFFSGITTGLSIRFHYLPLVAMTVAEGIFTEVTLGTSTLVLGLLLCLNIPKPSLLAIEKRTSFLRNSVRSQG